MKTVFSVIVVIIKIMFVCLVFVWTILMNIVGLLVSAITTSK